MTKNEVDIIKNSVLDATEAYVDARLSVADFVKTQIGVVQSATKVSKKWRHVVKCNSTKANPDGIIYKGVLSINNIHFTDGSVVFILAPNAQFSNQFILGKLDNVPYDIIAGSIKIGGTEENPAFYVDSSGNLFIGGGSASTANFYVTNQGVVTMKKGEINLGWDSVNNRYKFTVDDTGYLTARAGQIGGCNIGTNYLYYTDNSRFSQNIVGCGFAGNGIINLVGGTSSSRPMDYGYVQVSVSGSPTQCLNGIRITHNAEVIYYDGNGTERWRKDFSKIPD